MTQKTQIKQPTFDKDGYPTEETLRTIRHWGPTMIEDLMKFIASAWHWSDMAKQTSPGLWVFATGGWTGNEMLICALQESLAWLLAERICLPHGLVIIAINDKAKEKLKKMHQQIVNWAWAGGKQTQTAGKYKTNSRKRR